jgi:hypothetical protein
VKAERASKAAPTPKRGSPKDVLKLFLISSYFLEFSEWNHEKYRSRVSASTGKAEFLAVSNLRRNRIFQRAVSENTTGAFEESALPRN